MAYKQVNKWKITDDAEPEAIQHAYKVIGREDEGNAIASKIIFQRKKMEADQRLEGMAREHRNNS